MDWSTTSTFQINDGVHWLGAVDGDAFVRNGRSYAHFAGPTGALLCALREQRTLSSLLGPAHACLGNAELRWRLRQLVDAGYVRECSGTRSEADATGGTPTPAPAVRPGVAHADGHEALERGLQAALSRAGIADVHAFSVDHYLAPRGLELLLGPASADGGAARLPIAVFDGEAWLGPVLGQPDGPCPRCLLTRLWQNHPVERFLIARGAERQDVFSVARLPLGWLDRALTWMQRALPRLLAARASGSAALHRVDLASGVESQHAVQPRPQCPRCGDADVVRRRMFEPPLWRPPAPVAATAEPALIVSRDGGLRTLDPESTHRRLAIQIDPLVGRVGSLGQVIEKSNAYHQVFSAAYHRVPQRGEGSGTQEFSVLSGGKGRSPVQARTSALCEALERQCAQWEGDEAGRSGRYVDLAPDAVDPRSLLLFSDEQYLTGTPEPQRRHKSPRSQRVPAPFDVNEILDWSPVWALSDATLRWVPTQYCLDGVGVGDRSKPACCAWDSNGCAAGNTLVEATLQGLLELVERDAVAIWWYNRVPMPALSFAGLCSSVSRLIERHLRLGRRCSALDLTHDLGIPVAGVVLEEPSSGGFALGFGCHPVAEIALERAILELEQVLDGESRDLPLFNRAELEHDRFLLPDATRAPSPRFTGLDTHGRGELESTLVACVEELCARGLEPLLFNYSRPDVALHTVKVLVPGLRHFWPRRAPGRLYQVPVHMGWSSVPLSEADLNPLPLLM
jgi:bacteriocin biosynthesis cyclodehydratase domain-containing protein